MDSRAFTVRRIKMESQYNYEQEIDLKDLMFAVLRKWRPIILIAIVFAVLLGGMKGVSGLKQIKDSGYLASKQQEYDNSMEQYEISKESLEKEVENIKTSLESQNEYMEKSVLMNINPYDEYVTAAAFYVGTDYQIMPGMAYQNPNTASSIMQAYMSMIQNGDMYQYVLNGMSDPLDRRYLQELVTVTPNLENNMFDIRVISSSEEGASSIMELIMNSLNEYSQVITQAIGPHTLKVMSSSARPGTDMAQTPEAMETAGIPGVYTTVDLELEKQQQEQSVRIAELNQSLADKTKELSELKAPSISLPSKGGVVKSAVKYTVLGGVLGGFLSVFFICVAFLMSDKLGSDKELRRRYGLMVLGMFDSGDKKKPFAFVDRFLDRLEGTAGRKMDRETVCSVVAANVMNYAGDAKQLLLITSDSGVNLEAVKDDIAPVLTGLTVTAGGNLDSQADAIRKAASCDAVILVEKRKGSSFSGIERELDIVRSLDKKVLGCIVL